MLYTDSLASPDWQKLLDVPALPASQTVTVTDGREAVQTRFYQIVTPGLSGF